MTTDETALRGDFHFGAGETGLCAECSRCFPIAARSGDGAHRCPACGSTSFVIVEQALAAAGERIRSQGERIAHLERVVRWAAGEDALAIAPRLARRPGNASALLKLAGLEEGKVEA